MAFAGCKNEAGRKQFIEKTFAGTTKLKQIHEAILFVENSNGDFSHHISYGNKELSSPFLAASVTKLFTTACILVLSEQGSISLEDKLAKYFDNSILAGLHIYKGTEYSFDLTISDLLFNISGLPDSFEDGSTTNSNIMNAIIQNDIYLTFEAQLAEAKELNPRFIPRTPSKAYYANINFDLLGEIVEKVTQLSLCEAYNKFIFKPLGLENTYLPTNDNDYVPNVYYKNKSLHRPQLIMSCRASGGCVTTAEDLMVFIKSFWNGKLFDKKIFVDLSVYRKIQSSKGPIQYGGGYMRIPLDGAITLFMGKGELVGHSGVTGSFAFHYPQKDLFFVGDMNQLANPALPIRLLIKLAASIK
jgi:CubicO group peptidase (beta-lactamase class C family)